MSFKLSIQNVFVPDVTDTYVISGEVFPANERYIYVDLYKPGVAQLRVYTLVGGPGWSKFTFTVQVDGSQYTGLFLQRSDSGPVTAEIPGRFSTGYFRNISATRLIPANVSTTDILNAGRLNHLYNGCKITGQDFNVPSPDTPDNGPVVEVNFVNPNVAVASPGDVRELNDALETARMGRALVNIVPDPPVISSDRIGRALVNRTEEEEPPPSTTLGRIGRALVNYSPAPPTSGSSLTGRALVN